MSAPLGEERDRKAEHIALALEQRMQSRQYFLILTDSVATLFQQ